MKPSDITNPSQELIESISSSVSVHEVFDHSTLLPVPLDSQISLIIGGKINTALGKVVTDTRFDYKDYVQIRDSLMSADRTALIEAVKEAHNLQQLDKML